MKSLEKKEKLTDLQIAQIFKKQGIGDFNILLEAGSEKLKAYSEDLKNSEGEAERLAKTMNSGLTGAFKRVQSASESLKIGIIMGDIGNAIRIAADHLAVLY